MVDLAHDERRHLLTRLADLIGAVDLVLDSHDDEQLAQFRGVVVRLYLDLMTGETGPYDQESLSGR